ncbi:MULTISPECIES: SIS domain-containing protein [unclassified Sporolactobacillus]|uniref:SIS domain-containing protein n=1 Tax=unclassified Sporolactobacillus TaxID=2628533 RepID=UPI0023683227|nr:SIS domain-containing protein [Sporolactobacillus sp. CQH2019]MDD9150476.1 SIS domain-containing protein [Sporolactobacillus sp. CQH2019]
MQKDNQRTPLNGKEIILYARSIAPSLGKKEKLIVSFISNKYQELSQMTIGRLAQYLNVSEASITKVSKKLKCEGFYELRHKIVDYLSHDETSMIDEEQDDFLPGDDEQTILEKVFIHSITALQDTLSLIDRQELSKAARALKQATEKKIVLVGSGGSGILCEDFQHKLLKIGIIATMHRDANMQLMSASLVKRGDVVLGISHSGTTKDVLEVLRLAREKGATTICITNHALSPITEIAEIKLYSSARNSPLTGENAAARIVQLNILDVLFSILALYQSRLAYDNLLKTRSSVESKRTKS